MTVTETGLPSELLSSVHLIETTARNHLPKSYQRYRTQYSASEYEAAFKLYCHIDNVEGTERAKLLCECRQYAYFARHSETGKVQVISNACRLRWCPICGRARASVISYEVSNWIRLIRSPKFFTLTLAHSNRPLAEQVATLYKHFRLFRQHKVLKKRVRGGVWFFQVKRSKRSKDWHPHLHCVLDADYIDQRTLSQEWLLTTGNSFIVDIRGIKDPRKVAEDVSRYCSRPSNLVDFLRDDQLEMFTVFHGRRLCGGFGTGRCVRFKPRKSEDFVKWQRLGSWSHIISHRFAERACELVVCAFLTGKVVEVEAVKDLISELPDEQCLHTVPVLQVEDRQLQFKEFR